MRFIDWKRHRESGQATIEFVLVLVVGMLIALGLLYRFNMAFKKYTVDLYGTYYRCLLETGELPGVGSVCKDKKARFDIASGRDLIKNVPGSAGGGSGGTPGSGGSGTGGSGSTPKSGSGGTTTKNPDGSGGSKSGSTSGKGSGTSGSSGSGDGSGGSNGASESVGGGTRGSGGGYSSSVGRLRNSGRSRSTSMGNGAGSGSGSDKDGADKPEPLSAYSSSGSHSNSDALRRGRTKMDFKMEGGEYQRAETSAVAAVSASSMKAADKSGNSLRPRKAVESDGRKPAAKLEEDKGGGLSFGRIFRMFMIFGIIVAIIIFLGGQVLQISKSGEK